MWNKGKAKYVMKVIEEICRERGVLGAGELINGENVDACYKASFKKLVDRAYVTFCNVLRKKNMQKNKEIEQQVERPRTYAEMLRMDNVCTAALQDDGIGGGTR
eukprot:272079-Hanusia_phi.AAC.1